MRNGQKIKTSVVLIWVFFLVCNILLPLVSDDFGYILDSKFNGLNAITNSYLNHNARFFNLISFTYIAYIPRLLFDIINSVIGIGFILCFFVLIKGSAPSDRRDLFTLWLILALIICFNAFGSIFIWEIGAANYLHGFLVWTLCLIPYRKFWGMQLLNENHEKLNCGLVSLSLIAGWCFEQVGIITIFAFLLFLAVAAIKKIHLPFWYWSGVLLFVAGYCILYFAPGESVRGGESDSYIDVVSFLQGGFHFQIDRIVRGFQQYHSKQYMLYLFFMIVYLCATSRFFCKKWIGYIAAIFVCIVALIIEKVGLCIIDSLVLFSILAYRCISKGYEYRSLHRIILGLLFFYLLCCCCAALVPFPMRAKFGGDILLIISMILIFRHYYNLLNSKIVIIFSKSLYAYMVMACCFVIIAYADYRIKWEKALCDAQEQVNNGNSDIIMDKSVFTSFYPFMGEWINPGENPNIWPNVSYSEYYGWNSLTVK